MASWAGTAPGSRGLSRDAPLVPPQCAALPTSHELSKLLKASQFAPQSSRRSSASGSIPWAPPSQSTLWHRPQTREFTLSLFQAAGKSAILMSGAGANLASSFFPDIDSADDSARDRRRRRSQHDPQRVHGGCPISEGTAPVGRPHRRTSSVRTRPKNLTLPLALALTGLLVLLWIAGTLEAAAAF